MAAARNTALKEWPADGNSFAYSFVTTLDGTDAPVTGTGTPGGADAVALKRIDAHKTEGVLKKGGKEIAKVTTEMSKDGKVSTVKTKGKSSDGAESSSVSVYDKQ
jgi:hypothetical protein